MKHSISWAIKHLDLLKFIKYNYFSKNIVREKNVYLYTMKGSKLDISPKAIIDLQGDLYLGDNLFKGSKRETYLKLAENAKLIIKDETRLNYGVFLQAHKDAVISIGRAIFNSDSVIIAQKEIEIGHGVSVARWVTIFDSDFHPIFDEEGNRTNPPRKVQIGNRVWIGIKATILKGTKIKDGAVISANALVGGIVKKNTLYSALPGQAVGVVDWGNKNRQIGD